MMHGQQNIKCIINASPIFCFPPGPFTLQVRIIISMQTSFLSTRLTTTNTSLCNKCGRFPPTKCPLWTSWSLLSVVAEVVPTSEVGTPMRRSYVVPMRWMVIYEYEVPGGALYLNSTNLARPWSPRDLPLQGKIPMAEPGIEPGTS
jgi:hypothetical protein